VLQQKITYAVLEALYACPSAHDKGIICSHNGDYINTLRFELIVLLDVAGQVLGVARRGERAGDGEDDDLLALPRVGGKLGRNTARELILELGSPGDVGERGAKIGARR
jgi:hypothetical protein